MAKRKIRQVEETLRLYNKWKRLVNESPTDNCTIDTIDVHLYSRIKRALIYDPWYYLKDLLRHKPRRGFNIMNLPPFRMCLASKRISCSSFGRLGKDRYYFCVEIDELHVIISFNFYELIIFLVSEGIEYINYVDDAHIVGTFIDDLKKKIIEAYPRKRIKKSDFEYHCNAASLLKIISTYLQIMSNGRVSRSENETYDEMEKLLRTIQNGNKKERSTRKH